MKLYRYSSGLHFNRPGTAAIPKINAFFMSPDNKGDYPDACMAISVYHHVDHQSIITKNASLLDPRGADTQVVNTLQHLRWVHATDVPPALFKHEALKNDTAPAKSQWFVAEVPENYVQELEQKVAETLANTKKPRGGIMLFLVLLLAVGIIYYGVNLVGK